MRGGKILKTGQPQDIVPDLNPSEKEKMLTEE
jgi:methyl coenzyme M reductase system, component A2